MTSLVLCSLFALQISLSHGFYIPGVAPIEFHNGDKLVVKVKKIIIIINFVFEEHQMFPINAHHTYMFCVGCEDDQYQDTAAV